MQWTVHLVEHIEKQPYHFYAFLSIKKPLLSILKFLVNVDFLPKMFITLTVHMFT